MALLFVDGFTHYSTLTDKWDYINGTPVITSSQGRFQGNCMTFDSSEYVRKYFQPGMREVVVGFAFRFTSSVSASAPFVTFASITGGNHCYLTWNSTLTSSNFSVNNGAGSIFGTTSSSWTVNEWRYVEFRAKVGQTSGSYELRVDGVTELSGTNVDFYNASLELIEMISFGIQGSSGTVQMCDLYICDTTGSTANDFLGVMTVETIRPTADGANVDFTPLSSTNASNIDDTTPDGDSTYNSSATAGDYDSFTTGNLAVGGGVVQGLQTVVRARKTGVAFREISDTIRTNSLDFDGDNHALPQSYKAIRTLHAVNPDTGDPWTVAEINATEFGYKIQT